MMKKGDRHTAMNIIDRVSTSRDRLTVTFRSPSSPVRICGFVLQTYEYIKYIQLEKYRKASEDERATIETNAHVIFHNAIENCKPLMNLQKTERGGITYTVPIPIREEQRTYKAIMFILNSCSNTRGNRRLRVWERLARECINASTNQVCTGS